MTETLTGREAPDRSTPDAFVAGYRGYLSPEMTGCFVPCGRRPLALVMALAEVRVAERDGRRQRVELGPHGAYIRDVEGAASDAR